MDPLLERLAPLLREHYQIERELGAGGMATVYLARDLKHQRQVAIKVLRPDLSVSLGAERFLREIEFVGGLTHPHILTLLDSGGAADLLYYVMPYVEGESLRHRMDREGQLPVEDAVRIARGIASALKYAHEHGIIHRDIKPENILLASGEPVVADFGIARALTVAAGTALTATGLAIGTPAYMSPEQATADSKVDARSDLYSLGCVLYEMLAGEAPYTGPNAQAITAKKLAESVPALSALRPSVGPNLEYVVVTALARGPADRFASAQAFTEALDKAVSGTASASASASVNRSARRLFPWAFALLTVGAAVLLLWSKWSRSASEDIIRLGFSMPPGLELVGGLSAGAISPDGTVIVFVAGTADSSRLYLRLLDAFTVQALPGTAGGTSPFFSPDGRWIGFISSSEHLLKKVALNGGVPIVICDVPVGASGTWADNDTIYFVGARQLLKVSANGGTPIAVMNKLPPGYLYRRFPQALPGGRRALVTYNGGTMGLKRAVGLVDLTTGEERLLLDDAEEARWVAPDYLVFLRPGTNEVAGIRFDRVSGKTQGTAVTVIKSVRYGSGGAGLWDVSRTGTFAYAPASVDSTADGLMFVDRSGRADPRPIGVGNGPRFSPDGRTLVFHRGTPPHIWTRDLAREVDRRETFGDGAEYWPMWSPDGNWILFSRIPRPKLETSELYRQHLGGGSSERLTHEAGSWKQSAAWALGGRELVFTKGEDPRTGMDVFAMELPDGSPRPILASTSNEQHPDVSRDGRFLAYDNDASGVSQIFVRRYPDGPDVRASLDGGRGPIWSPDGRQLYYRSISGQEVYTVPVSGADSPSIGKPTLLFRGPFAPSPSYSRGWDVTADGQRFVFTRAQSRFNSDRSGVLAGNEMRVIVGWSSELRRLIRAQR